MITYTDFRRLLSDVSECPTLDAYIAEVGGSLPTDDVSEIPSILTDIWEMAHDGLTIKSIATVSGRSVLALSRELGLNRRTVENWAAGIASPPAGQLPIIAYAALNLYK